jgi:hypothetical protein
MAGLGERCNYELPVTQEQLADALGLTAVHTNRTLKNLGEEGLISRTNRSVRIDDWPNLMTPGTSIPPISTSMEKAEPPLRLERCGIACGKARESENGAFGPCPAR